MLRILAAFMMFTRLPFWRVVNVPAEYFKQVVPLWPLTGWLTAGCSVIVLYAVSLFLPLHTALLLAIITRLLLTGCLHEDGLADFFDGFGGGTSRERILAIMKDSHIGTYGVTGLIAYFAMNYSLLSHLPPEILGSVMLAADPFSKGVASMTINRLPYVRKEEDSKNKLIYNRMTASDYILAALFAVLPLLWLPRPEYLAAVILPLMVWFFLTSWINKKIQGYTGDCCGALFLLCETCFYLGIALVACHLYPLR